MIKTCIIGAGAAGLLAAHSALLRGEDTLILEKNEKAGKKIYITGKGRCNVTNACDSDIFMKNIVRGGRFMYSALSSFGPSDLTKLLSDNHLRTKIERGNRVFPVTDHASDVTKALLSDVLSKGCAVKYNEEVTGIEKEGGSFRIRTGSESGRRSYKADKVIVCTGGLSYPSTGSTGDGYRFAQDFGHKVTEPVPSLCQINTVEDTSALAGISLINTGLRAVRENGKNVFSDTGELLFTHSGISGPMALTVSSLYARELYAGEKMRLIIDLKPGLTEDMLSKRILRDFSENENAYIINALSKLLIKGIREEVIRRSGIAPEKKVNGITRAERELLVKIIKGLSFTANGTGGFNEAVITCGGVSLKEIDPRTMESKLVPGLYFAGEVLDVDAFTGGFNLQIAFSTGFCAGRS